MFERTFAANGTDTITDFSAVEDILDFSLVGFARGVFNRDIQSNIVRVDYSAGTARVLLDLDGGGNFFQPWAVLENVAIGATLRISIGGVTLNSVVTDYPPQIQSFRVSGVNQLSVTVDQASTAGLYLPGTGTLGMPAMPPAPAIPPSPGTSVGSPISLAANTPGTITVAAQATKTTAVLRVTDGTTVVSPSPDVLVELGTNFGDSLFGGSAADIIFGFDGQDSIFSNGGADTVQAGDGDDFIVGGAGADDLGGGEGNDTFVFATQAELVEDATVDGGNGTDTLTVQGTTLQSADFARVAGMEVLNFAGTAAHSITLGAATNTAFASGITITANPAAASLTVEGAASTVAINATGTNNADALTGGSGNDVLGGGAGADTLTGGAGADNMDGGADMDVFIIASAADHAAGESITGGDGNSDIIRFTSTAGATLTLTANVDVEQVRIANAAGVATGTTNESINAASVAGSIGLYGNNGNNSLTGNAADNFMDAGGGNDTLTGGGGNDFLTGGLGNDRFNADAGTANINDLSGGDVLVVSAGAIATAFVTGNFTATATTSNAGTASLTLDDGISANLALATGPVGYSVSAASNTAASTIVGSGFDDTLTGGAGADSIEGDDGDDTVKTTLALMQADTVDGGVGTADVVEVTDAGSVTDAMFTNYTTVEVLKVTGSSSVALNTEAFAAGIRTVVTGAGATGITLQNAYNVAPTTLFVDADLIADGSSLALSDSANPLSAFTVTNLEGDLVLDDLESDLLATFKDITGNAATVTVNDTVTGTGSITLVGNNATDVITVTGVSKAITITGSVATFNVVGDANAQTVVLDGGNDTVTGGAGIDTINVGTGTDYVVLRDNDSGANTATGSFVRTEAFDVYAGFDIYSGLGFGDQLEIFRSITWNFFASVVTSDTDVGGIDDAIVFTRGTYDSGTNRFNATGTGADTLVTYDVLIDYEGGTDYESIVLVGFVGLSDRGVSSSGHGAIVTLQDFG